MLVAIAGAHGKIAMRLAARLAARGDVPRDDVAAVLAAVLHDPRANHRILYVNGGEDPLEDVLAHVLAAD